MPITMTKRRVSYINAFTSNLLSFIHYNHMNSTWYCKRAEWIEDSFIGYSPINDLTLIQGAINQTTIYGSPGVNSYSPPNTNTYFLQSTNLYSLSSTNVSNRPSINPLPRIYPYSSPGATQAQGNFASHRREEDILGGTQDRGPGSGIEPEDPPMISGRGGISQMSQHFHTEAHHKSLVVVWENGIGQASRVTEEGMVGGDTVSEERTAVYCFLSCYYRLDFLRS